MLTRTTGYSSLQRQVDVQERRTDTETQNEQSRTSQTESEIVPKGNLFRATFHFVATTTTSLYAWRLEESVIIIIIVPLPSLIISTYSFPMDGLFFSCRLLVDTLCAVGGFIVQVSSWSRGAPSLGHQTHIPELLLVIWRFVHINDISLIFVASLPANSPIYPCTTRHALLIRSKTF